MTTKLIPQLSSLFLSKEHCASGLGGNHHIPKQDSGYIENAPDNVRLVHVVVVPELRMLAVLEIAEYEDARPAIQDILHVLEATPCAIIVPIDLLPRAEIVLEKPIHLIHSEQIVA